MATPGKPRFGRFTWVLVLVVIAAIAGGIFVIRSGPDAGPENWPARFASNGERIYFTGTSASGLPITPVGGAMHMRMHGGSCVSCHGTDLLGGRMMPRFWVTAPPLTPEALFGGHDEAGDDGHGDHDDYDDTTLARAITRGIDPAAEALDEAMPRWRMAEQDLADLLAFLRGYTGE